MKKIKLLLADDHQLFRKGLKALLLNNPDIDSIDEASNGQEAIDLATKTLFDLILLDIDMPGLSGIEVTRLLNLQAPTIPVIILSMHKQKPFIEAAIEAGAKGYLLKDADFETLSLAIKKVTTGDVFFDSKITATMMGKSMPDTSNVLSEKELIILKHIAEGLTNKLIADKLFLSSRTIDTYRANMMKKLQVSNVAELIKYAVKNGLLN